MSDENIETVSRAHEAAVSGLLLEYDAQTPRELSKLVKNHNHLVDALEAVKVARKQFHDVVFVEANKRLNIDKELDSMIACVQIINDDTNDYEWVAFPEVEFTINTAHTVTLLKTSHQGKRVLIRELPRSWVGEIRNVPKDHVIALTAKQWTLANQGQPDWADELALFEPQIQHLANSHGIDPDVLRRYVASEGEFPDEDWYQLVKATNLQATEVRAAMNAE